MQQFQAARWLGLLVTGIAILCAVVSLVTKLFVQPSSFLVDVLACVGAYLFCVTMFVFFRAAAKLPREGNAFLFIRPSDETIQKVAEEAGGSMVDGLVLIYALVLSSALSLALAVWVLFRPPDGEMDTSDTWFAVVLWLSSAAATGLWAYRAWRRHGRLAGSSRDR